MRPGWRKRKAAAEKRRQLLLSVFEKPYRVLVSTRDVQILTGLSKYEAAAGLLYLATQGVLISVKGHGGKTTFWQLRKHDPAQPPGEVKKITITDEDLEWMKYWRQRRDARLAAIEQYHE